MRVHIRSALVIMCATVGVANSASVDLFSGTSNYKEYSSKNESISLHSNIGNGYSRSITMSKEAYYSDSTVNGNMTTSINAEVSQLAIGVNRTFRYNSLYLSPEIGAGFTVVDVDYKVSYNNLGSVEGRYLPFNSSVIIRQSKTFILPYASIKAGVYLSSNISIFYKYKYSFYQVHGIGIGFGF